MDYRINQRELIEIIRAWNSYFKRKIHFIACGGTAMTLLGVKESTKDIDFMVPDIKEYDYLIKILKQLGYSQKTGWGWSKPNEPFIFDFFPGKRIHTTELLESPMIENRHSLFKEFSKIYVGILNDYDLITSKLMRGASVDFNDCLLLVKMKNKEIDINRLRNHFYELASYDVAEDRLKGHWPSFERLLKEENLYAG